MVQHERGGELRILWRFEQAGAVDGWAAIDDRVMGGVSSSRLRHDPAGHAVFEGFVSLDRQGGFASVRSPVGRYGRSGDAECVVELRGEPKRYKLGLFTGSGRDAWGYQIGFVPHPGRWSLIRLPLSQCRAVFRGRPLPDAPPLDPAAIRQFGLVIADRQAGPFALELRSIGLSDRPRRPGQGLRSTP
jgi:hypothetical protein